MATAALPVQQSATGNDRAHLFRLLTLSIDEGTTLVRNIFDDKRPNVPLDVFLAQEKTAINRLRASKTITKVQYDLMFSPICKPTTADFDITLTICLLRNIKTFRLNPHFTWNTQPLHGDTSLEADLRRLQMFRNELAHISATTGISEPDFKVRWSNIEQVLIRLNNSLQIPKPNLQQTINYCKNHPLDLETQTKIENTIKEMQKLDLLVQVVEHEVYNFKDNLREVKDEVHDVTNVVYEVKDDIHDVTNVVNEVKDDVHDVTNVVNEVKNEVHEVKNEVHEVKDEVYKIKDKVRDVKVDVQDIKGVVFEVKNDVHEAMHEIHDVTNRVYEVKDDVHEVKDKVCDVEAAVFEVKDDVHDVKVDVHKLNKQMEEIQTKSIGDSQETKTNIFTRLKRRIQLLFKKRGEEEEYIKNRNNLKEDLITLYRQQYHTLPLSPLIEEHDTPLIDFYVTPDINAIEGQRSVGGGREIKSKITSLHDVFHKKTKPCREIYLLADAGLGKTAFSKRLALTWCQAHKRNEDDSECFEKGETDMMSEFDFVFLLSLRDCSEECDIDRMIRKQILPLLAHKSNITEIVLSKDKCLVILDGLDEWSHPKTPCSFGKTSDIPHRRARNCVTTITTCRPWKFSVVNLKSSQIDQRLELDGLSEKSSDKLKRSVITLLNHKAEQAIDDQIEDFNSTIDEKGVYDLETVPLLLMYLLCLWCDDVDLGRSKCVIYFQIIEMLLKQTFKKFPNMKNLCPRSTSDIPHCLDAQANCRENYLFMTNLGRLAFKTLFSKTRENTLVFDRLLVDKYLNTDCLELSLSSGIITQDKEKKLTSEKQKASFSHKTVQEFFAALYISTCSDQDKVLKEVISSCNSISDILETSEVFIFISGINLELFSSISEKLMKVINEDEITSTYRSETWPTKHEKATTPLKELQDLFIYCIEEVPESSDVKICLQDYIFDKSCQQENYYSNLQRLAVQNKNNIKSIGIEREGIRSLPEIITQCEYSDPSINCQKILYQGECKEAELIPLLSRQVKCVAISSSEWRDNRFIGKYSSWSRKLSKIVQNNNQLQAIYVYCFSFSHDVLEDFLNYLVNRKSMKEIKLYYLLCTDHGASCPGFNFDLSQHTELRCLGLINIPLSQLNVNVSLLEECTVGEFSNPGIVTSYLCNISAASKLHLFECDYLKSSDDIETMLQTLSSLVTVKHVRLWNVNLGESLLPHEIVNIEYVMLEEVTMSSQCLINLVFWIENHLPQQVTVEMVDCKITPEIEFEEIKENIRTSKNFVVIYDDKTEDDSYSFEFKSLK